MSPTYKIIAHFTESITILKPHSILEKLVKLKSQRTQKDKNSFPQKQHLYRKAVIILQIENLRKCNNLQVTKFIRTHEFNILLDSPFTTILKATQRLTCKVPQFLHLQKRLHNNLNLLKT